MSEAMNQQRPDYDAECSGRELSEELEPIRELTSMRLIAFFSLLRRSTVLSQRRQFDVSEIEWRILVNVGEYAPLSLNGLAELLLQDRGQLSRAVKGMVKRGLLTRERKPGGPEIEIELAPEGRLLHRRMVDFVIRRDRMLMEGIDDEDVETLRRVIEVMIGRARGMMDEEQRMLGS